MAEPRPNPNSAVNPQLKKAAVALTNHACTLSVQHIQDGMLRLQFNREIAYYAQGIVRDVEGGRKSVEEGVKALEGERESLLGQAWAIIKQGIGLAAGGAQVVGGVGICVGSRGVGCAPGAMMALHGANNIYENGNNLIQGRTDTEGWLRDFYQWVSQDDRRGNIAYGLGDLAFSGYGLARLSKNKDAWRLFRYIRTDYLRGYEKMGKGALGFEILSDGLTLSQTYEEYEK